MFKSKRIRGIHAVHEWKKSIEIMFIPKKRENVLLWQHNNNNTIIVNGWWPTSYTYTHS